MPPLAHLGGDFANAVWRPFSEEALAESRPIVPRPREALWRAAISRTLIAETCMRAANESAAQAGDDSYVEIDDDEDDGTLTLSYDGEGGGMPDAMCGTIRFSGLEADGAPGVAAEGHRRALTALMPAKGKARATLGQLLCHTAGVAPGFPAVPADKQGDLEAVVAAVCATPAVSVPGEEASYSQIMAHAVAAECVRRLDGSGLRFRDIVKRDILAPLGMTDTCLGMRADLASRGVVPRCTDRSPGLFDPDALVAAAQDIMNPALDHEMPAAGFVSTLNDICAFAEALRCGGRRGEARVLSPAMVAFATRNHTGTMVNTQWHFAREMKGWPALSVRTLFEANPPDSAQII